MNTINSLKDQLDGIKDNIERLQLDVGGPAVVQEIREKRILEQATRNVKKARIEQKSNQLRCNLLHAKDQLEMAITALYRQEKYMENCPLHLIKQQTAFLENNKAKLQQRIADVINAENAIMDFTEDEE